MTPPSEAATLPPISEKAFMAQVMQLARLRGWRLYHTWSSRHSAAGFPDLVLVRQHKGAPGELLFAELKAERGKVTAEQWEWITALKATGQSVFIWRPSQWPEIERVLA